MPATQQTFRQFSFEAAHATPPFSTLHGHSFCVTVGMTGTSDPIFGWSHNLYEIDPIIEGVRALVDHKYLNDVPGLDTPTLENVTRWVWAQLDPKIVGLDQVTVKRGSDGQAEGCTLTRNRTPADV